MNKIFLVTSLIQSEFPELYEHLDETPLLLSYTQTEIKDTDFEKYLESIDNQRLAFENAATDLPIRVQ